MTTRVSKNLARASDKLTGTRRNPSGYDHHNIPAVGTKQVTSRTETNNDLTRKTDASANVTQSAAIKRPSTRKESARRSTAVQLTSYADMLRAAYGPTRRRWKPTGSEIREMLAGQKLDQAERDQLLDMAALDRTLKRTRELMLFGLNRLDGGNGERPVRGFVRDVLLRHPAYQLKSLETALEHPDRTDDKHAVQIISALNYASLPWRERVKFSTTAARTCRTNVLHCLLLWFRESLLPPLPLERIHHYLHRELWVPSAARRTSESERVQILIKNRDHAATAIACSTFEELAVESRQQADVSRAAASRAISQTRRLEKSLTSLEERLKDAQTRLERATHDLNAERSDRSIERTHLQDDYEKLRGRVVRRLDAELSLLKEGLQALRRNPPKVAVMDDHADRAIDGLTCEIDRLRKE